jgi:hypothetical protein
VKDARTSLWKEDVEQILECLDFLESTTGQRWSYDRTRDVITTDVDGKEVKAHFDNEDDDVILKSPWLSRSYQSGRHDIAQAFDDIQSQLKDEEPHHV